MKHHFAEALESCMTTLKMDKKEFAKEINITEGALNSILSLHLHPSKQSKERVIARLKVLLTSKKNIK